jgi:hypothetical protein
MDQVYRAVKMLDALYNKQSLGEMWELHEKFEYGFIEASKSNIEGYRHQVEDFDALAVNIFKLTTFFTGNDYYK